MSKMFNVPMEFPIQYAVSIRDYKLIEELLAQGADINAVGRFGRTPLGESFDDNKEMCESFEDRSSYKMTKFLIEKGADVNIKCNSFEYPLHIFGGEESFARLLVENPYGSKADVNCRNSFGETPLHLAVRNCRPAGAKYLIENGADINAKDNDGISPLDNVKNNKFYSTEVDRKKLEAVFGL